MQAYNRQDYVTAKKLFQHMVADTPEDSLGHYYLANTMVFLKDAAGATREYQIAIDNADSDDMKGNCETALKSLKKAGYKGAAEALKASATASVPTNPGAGVGGFNGTGPASAGAGTKQAAAADLPPVPLENQSLLQRQAEERWQSALLEAETQQKAILEAAKQQATRIKADHTVDPSFTYRRGGRAYADALKKEGNDQASSVLKRASDHALEYQKFADQKKAVIDDVVNSLDSQMNQTAGVSKIHLKREGTNLNVRNYEFSH